MDLESACIQRLIGTLSAPSFYDVLFVNRLYQCRATCDREKDVATTSIPAPAASFDGVFPSNVASHSVMHSPSFPQSAASLLLSSRAWSFPSATSCRKDGDSTECYWAPGCKRCLCPEKWRDRVCKQEALTDVVSSKSGALRQDIDENRASIESEYNTDGNLQNHWRQGFEINAGRTSGVVGGRFREILVSLVCLFIMNG